MGFGGGRLGLAAFGVALAAAAYAFLVYRWWVPPAAMAAALVSGYLLRKMLSLQKPGTYALAALGLALTAFSVFGPRDGLF